HAEPLLKSIKADEPEYEVAQKMLKFLSEFDSYDDDGVVPNDSIIREFIGGSAYADEDPETGKKTFVGSNYFLRNIANFFRDKHEVLKEKHEEFWEKHDDLKKDLIEKHEELVDSFEEAVEEAVESIEKGEGEHIVK
ncbi:MAG: hypothetical protein IJH69_04485, partial [Firmicutes bacterium]|nr:hypothetical protein [Bacillota bacterium]